MIDLASTGPHTHTHTGSVTLLERSLRNHWFVCLKDFILPVESLQVYNGESALGAHTSTNAVFEFWWQKVNMFSMEVHQTRTEAAALLWCRFKSSSLKSFRLTEWQLSGGQWKGRNAGLYLFSLVTRTDLWLQVHVCFSFFLESINFLLFLSKHTSRLAHAASTRICENPVMSPWYFASSL